MPHTNQAGLSLLTGYESEVLYAYDDLDGKYPHPPIMPGDPVKGTLSIGVGHTSAAGAPMVVPGMKITHAQSQAILARDLAKFESEVNVLVGRNASSNEFSAMVDFAYNCGAGALVASGIMPKFNTGDIQGAANAFLNRTYMYSNGVFLESLERRRHDERALFLKP